MSQGAQEAKWNEICARVGDRRPVIRSSEDNAYDTISERHGRVPEVAGDPLWEDLFTVAISTYEFMRDMHGDDWDGS